MIPILNPNRPPKEWFDKVVKTLSEDRSVNDAKAIAGWLWYHKMRARKKAEVLTKEMRGGNISISKADIAAVLHRRKTASGPKHNGGSLMSRRRRSHRRNASKMVWHRPRVRKSPKGFFHAPKSSFFGSAPVRVNRHRRRHGMRLNPFNLKATFSRITNKQWLMSVASLSGGLVAGLVANTVIKSQMGKVTSLNAYSKYSGVLNIVLGSLMVSFGKKKMIKEAGVAVAAVGLYDLVSVNVQQLGLPVIGDVRMPSFKAAGSYPVYQLPVSPVASVAGSYGSPVRAGYSGSYQAPDMVTEGFHGDNSPYQDIDF